MTPLLERFYRANAEQLKAQLRRQFPRQADEVDDAVQHACLKALQSSAPILDLNRFVARVASNYLIDGVRRERRIVPESPEFSVDDLPAAPSAPVGEEERFDRARDCTERALEQVGEPSRSLVTLKHVQGCDYKQIAERLGISPGSVGTMLLRARRRVRALALDCLGVPAMGDLA